MSILAIDLGQSKSVFAFRGRDGQEKLGSFDTNAGRLRKLLARLAPKQIVVEVCPLAAKVHDIAQEFGIPAPWPTRLRMPGAGGTSSARPTAMMRSSCCGWPSSGN